MSDKHEPIYRDPQSGQVFVRAELLADRDRELAQLKADHAEMVRRNAALRTRHDLPVDRVKALDSFIAERDAANRALAGAMRIVYQLVHGGDHHEITAAMQDGLQWLARHAPTNNDPVSQEERQAVWDSSPTSAGLPDATWD